MALFDNIRGKIRRWFGSFSNLQFRLNKMNSRLTTLNQSEGAYQTIQYISHNFTQNPYYVSTFNGGAGGSNAETQAATLSTLKGPNWDGTDINFTHSVIRGAVFRIPADGTVVIKGLISASNFTSNDGYIHVFKLTAAEIENSVGNVSGKDAIGFLQFGLSGVGSVRSGLDGSFPGFLEGEYLAITFYNNTSGSKNYYSNFQIGLLES